MIEPLKTRRGRPHQDINNPFILTLMESCRVDNLKDLADVTGISYTTLKGWETGKTSPRRTLEIALALQSATGDELKDLLKKAP